MSLISEQVKRLRKEAEEWDGMGETELQELLRGAADTLEVLSEKCRDGWIRFSDKKPKFGEDVLILIKHSDGTYQQAFSALYDYTYWTNFGRDIYVTHWKPLLELPEDVKE